MVDSKQSLLDEYQSEDGFVMRLHDRVWDAAALDRLLAAQSRYLASPRDIHRFEREVAQAFWLPYREARRYSAGMGLPRAQPAPSHAVGCERLFDLGYSLFGGESVCLDGSTVEAAPAVPTTAPAPSPHEQWARSELLDESLLDTGFVMRLRSELQWDDEAFERLVGAMRRYLAARGDGEWLDREASEVFWYLEWFVTDWLSHPNFPRPHPPEYYRRAMERLGDLAIVLFVGGDVAAAGMGVS